MTTITNHLDALKAACDDCDALLGAHQTGDDFTELSAKLDICSENMQTARVCYEEITTQYRVLKDKYVAMKDTITQLIEEDAAKKEAAAIDTQRAAFNATYATQYDNVFKQINSDLRLFSNKMDAIKDRFASGDISLKACQIALTAAAYAMNARVSKNRGDVQYILDARRHCAHELRPHYVGCFYYMNPPDEKMQLFDLCYSFNAPDFYVRCCSDDPNNIDEFYNTVCHMAPHPDYPNWLMCNICKYVTYTK